MPTPPVPTRSPSFPSWVGGVGSEQRDHLGASQILASRSCEGCFQRWWAQGLELPTRLITAWLSERVCVGPLGAERRAHSLCLCLCLPWGGSHCLLTPPLLCLKGWEKGVVFVNGYNLGRYWNIGPQETLYLPGVWLNEGINQVGVLFLRPLLVPALPGSQSFPGGAVGEQEGQKSWPAPSLRALMWL